MSKPIIAVIVGIIGTVIILFLAYQVFNLQNQIDKNLNCALAKTITRNIPYASEGQGVYDLEALALIFDELLVGSKTSPKSANRSVTRPRGLPGCGLMRPKINFWKVSQIAPKVV